MKVNSTTAAGWAAVLTILLAVCCCSFAAANEDDLNSIESNSNSTPVYEYDDYDEKDYDETGDIHNNASSLPYNETDVELTNTRHDSNESDDEATLPPLLDFAPRPATDNLNTTTNESDATQSTCPPGCHCDNAHAAQFVNCSHLELSTIPALPASIIQLDLSHNHIDHIHAGAFATATQLRRLYLNNNQLTGITADDFSAAQHLVLANFSANRIAAIDADAFAGAADLETLSLAHNPIQLDAEHTFLNLPELQELDMEGCALANVYNATFRNLTGLVAMNLRNNSFDENLNVIAFMNMTELRKLKLSAVPRASIRELCDMLAAIDRISADDYDVSCYEVSAGQTFEDSTHTPAPKHRIVTTTPAPRKNNRIPPIIQPTIATKPDTTASGKPMANATTTAQPNASEGRSKNGSAETVPLNVPIYSKDTSDSHSAQQSDSKTMRYSLYAIAAFVLVALFAVAAYRFNLCGLRTAMFRKRRNAAANHNIAADQVQPAELQPLKDIELRVIAKQTA